ncbi:MAG: hypothetical protein ACRC5A_06805 [Enterobacteriaceae bacterium]
MHKNNNTHYNLYLTLAQISSVLMALWVLYFSIKSLTPPVARELFVVVEEFDPALNTLLWAAKFFALALLIALCFIALTFVLHREE